VGLAILAFNTLVFPAFFLVVFLLFWATPWLGARKLLLLVFSYVFYSSFQPSHLLILIGLTALNYAGGLWLGRTRFRKPALALIVTADLGTLAFYKYIDFAVVNLNSVLLPAGISFAAPGILLPIGISFYTFEVISYIVDVYRGKIKPERSLLDFALLLAFFPRLVAGPIVRPADFLPQLKVIQTAQIGAGLQLVVIGMFQKLVIADYAMAPVVDWYFAIWTHTSSFDTWIAVLAFAIQIYCDFNGYTLCAIGLALLLGFRLPVNFANPYAAIGFSDFWRRWHISLSSWIRDYLYIPLGGSRHGKLWTCVSLLIAMTLAGLWHGASWNFVLWGLIHGTVLCVEHVLRRPWAWATARMPLLTSVPVTVVLWFVTLAAVCVAWVPFRAPSWQVSMSMLSRMADLQDITRPFSIAIGDAILVLTTAVVIIGVQLVDRFGGAEVLQRWYVRGAAYGVMIAALAAMGGDLRSFIYFQF